MKNLSILTQAIVLTTMIAGLGTSAHAAFTPQPLATYDFYGYNGTGPDPDTAPPTTSSLVTASDLSRSASAVDPTYIANTFAFDGADQSSEAAAISAGRYISFTITPTSTPVVLSSVTFYGFARNSGSEFALTSNGGGTTYSTVAVAAGDANSNQSLTLDFTPSAVFHGVLVTAPTTFDIYAYGNPSYYNENGFGNGADDIGFSVNGAVVPEPGAYALLGLGLLFLGLTVRKLSRIRK